MLDLSKLQNLPGYDTGAPYPTNNNVRLVHTALSRFEQALSEGRRRRFWARLLRRSTSLIDLSLYRLGITGCHYAGIKEVKIAEIRGSEGRAQDFDDHFRPLSERSCERWTSIAMARSENMPLPPVVLVKVGRYYFVRDGHHRLSVAAKSGQECIEAEVTVMEADGPLPWEAEANSRQVRAIKTGLGHGAYFIGG